MDGDFGIKITNSYYSFNCAGCGAGVSFNTKNDPEAVKVYNETRMFKCDECGVTTHHKFREAVGGHGD